MYCEICGMVHEPGECRSDDAQDQFLGECAEILENELMKRKFDEMTTEAKD